MAKAALPLPAAKAALPLLLPDLTRLPSVTELPRIAPRLSAKLCRKASFKSFAAQEIWIISDHLGIVGKEEMWDEFERPRDFIE